MRKTRVACGVCGVRVCGVWCEACGVRRVLGGEWRERVCALLNSLHISQLLRSVTPQEPPMESSIAELL
jgi:hypothetical protein